MSSVNLRFIFASHEGVNVLLTVPLETTVGDLKKMLIEKFPESIPVVDDLSRLR